MVSLPQPPAIQRPANASFPSGNFASLAGVYRSAGYNNFELCLVSPKNPSASSSCEALTANLSTILPGAIDYNVPTFIGEWDSPWLSHVRLSHFNGNIFNVSGLTSFVSPLHFSLYRYSNFPLASSQLETSRNHIGHTVTWLVIMGFMLRPLSMGLMLALD